MRFRDRRVRLAVLVLTPISLILALCLLLAYGNPQWHKYVFIFQFILREEEPKPGMNYTGTWNRWAPTGQLIAQEHYSHGKRQGPKQEWDSTGHKRLETSYEHGELHGHWVTYYEDGSILTRGEYSNGERIGRWTGFHPDGRPSFEKIYSRPGVLDGEERFWTSAGELRTLRVWRDGQPWNGNFQSIVAGDLIVTEYVQGTLMSQTNLGPPQPPPLPRPRRKAISQ